MKLECGETEGVAQVLSLIRHFGIYVASIIQSQNVLESYQRNLSICSELFQGAGPLKSGLMSQTIDG